MALIFATIASVTLYLGIGAAGQIRPFGPLIEKAKIQVPSILQLMFASYEVLDPREYRYTLSNPTIFKEDMLMLLSRAKDLQNLPYTWESIPFPDNATATTFLQKNRDYGDYLEKTYELYPDSIRLKTAIADNNLLYKIWDAARDAKTGIYYVYVRRRSLETLKKELDKINPTWFYQGKMPPHVPEWYFIYINRP